MTTSIVFCTGGSGGLGKSTGSRWLAHTAAQTGAHVVLVDGNPGQQSQRMFLNIPDTYNLESARLEGLRRALVPPKRLNQRYAMLAGPSDPHDPDMSADYLDAILAICGMDVQLIVVDADRIDERQWDDPDSFPGGVIRPLVDQHDARICFRIGQTGSQLDDGLAALSAIDRAARTLAIGVTPLSARPLPSNRWRDMTDGLARFGGVDQWTTESARMIDDRKPGWPAGREPTWLRHTLTWLHQPTPAVKETRSWCHRR